MRFQYKGQLLLLMVAMALLVWLPSQLPTFWVRTFAMIFLFIFWSSAWNIIGGMAGEINFLHPVFIGVGAYTSSVLYLRMGISPWVGMMIGALIAVVIAFALGWICYRSGLPRLSFALITLGFTHIAVIVAMDWHLLGGTRGLVIRPAAKLRNMQFATVSGNYYMGLVMAFLMICLCLWISRSKLGYYMRAIKNNDMAASAIGINIVGYRLIALCISAFFTAMGGTFYAMTVRFIDPHSAVNIIAVITIILFCAVGGFGTVWGPVVGTAILMPIGEVLRLHLMTGLHLVVYGVVVIIVILVAPHGLVPWFKTAFKKE